MALHILIRVLMVLLFLGALGDYASTTLALSTPGVAEANALEAWFQRVLGPAWIIPRIAFALAQIAAGLILSDNHWQAAATFGFGVLISAYAIWNNLRLWRANRVNSV